MSNALIVNFNLDPSQVRIDLLKLRDPLYEARPSYVVSPGAVRPYGGGDGTQEGGGMYRIQDFSIYYYGQSKYDQHEQGQTVLMDPALGTLNTFERIRQLFAYTIFGNSDGSNALLSEPLKFVSEGRTVWESQEEGIFSREFAWRGPYWVPLPSQMTLSMPAVTYPNR